VTASVRISAKCARLIVDAFAEYVPPGVCCKYGHAELEAAIAKFSRSSATRRTLAKPKRQKKASKKSERAFVRSLLVHRAQGACEACGNEDDGLQMDHFWGRAKAPEQEDTCWLLCFHCHDLKTRNHPGAAYWLSLFIEHSGRYGFTDEVERAKARLHFTETRSALSAREP
jgi:5-methylcytosine-specific restriction endonuclease McrA